MFLEVIPSCSSLQALEDLLNDNDLEEYEW